MTLLANFSATSVSEGRGCPEHENTVSSDPRTSHKAFQFQYFKDRNRKTFQRMKVVHMRSRLPRRRIKTKENEKKETCSIFQIDGDLMRIKRHFPTMNILSVVHEIGHKSTRLIIIPIASAKEVLFLVALVS